MHYEDHQLHARVSQDAWYLRFYIWLWEADPDRVDFCKLFWGLAVFAWVGLLLKPFIVGGEWLGNKLDDRRRRRVQAQPELSWEEKAKLRRQARAEAEARLKRRQERFERWFGWAPVLADRIVGFAQRSWPVVKWPVYGVGAILAAATVGGAGYGLYYIATTNPAWFLIIPGLVLGALILTGIILLVRTQPVAVAATNTKEVGLTFGQALSKGIHGVKSRTCPKIEII
jgi:hypothetical protein